MIEENLPIPFETTVLAVPVTVERIELDRTEQIVAVCRRGRDPRALPILDLPLPAPPPDGADWIEARKRFRLSHAHVKMARELGMNPRKLGKLDNHDQEPWKAPLPRLIEHLYLKRFGRDRPAVVLSIEERARAKEAKGAARKEAKRCRRAEGDARPPAEP